MKHFTLKISLNQINFTRLCVFNEFNSIKIKNIPYINLAYSSLNYHCNCLYNQTEIKNGGQNTTKLWSSIKVFKIHKFKSVIIDKNIKNPNWNHKQIIWKWKFWISACEKALNR